MIELIPQFIEAYKTSDTDLEAGEKMAEIIKVYEEKQSHKQKQPDNPTEYDFIPSYDEAFGNVNKN